MARTIKNTVAYFPHDANASEGDTLTILQNRYGNDGYAFWFKILEKLCSTDGHYIDCSNPVRWELLLAKCRIKGFTTDDNSITTVEMGESIVKTLVDLDAIDRELWEVSRIIWCQNLVDNIADVYKNRRRDLPQKPVVSCRNTITTDRNTITTGGGTQTKLKKIKPYKIKIEKGENSRRLKELFKILRQCPAIKSSDSYKLPELLADYPNINYDLEFKKFVEWWPGPKKRKEPWLVLRNWLGGRSGEYRQHSKGTKPENRYEWEENPEEQDSTS